MDTLWEASDPGFQARFWNYVGAGGLCWEWNGAKTDDGYGVIGLNGKKLRAHRIAYILAYGSVPDGLFVCHHCDNRACVNPLHLYAGTAADNNRDTQERSIPFGGKQHKGWHWNRRFADADVLVIRERFSKGESTAILASDFECKAKYIRKIVTGQRYPKLPGPIVPLRKQGRPRKEI